MIVLLVIMIGGLPELMLSGGIAGVHGLSKPGDFRKCADTSFCKRNRWLQANGGLGFDVDDKTIRMDGHRLVGEVYSERLDTRLSFTVSPLEDGTVRFQAKEKAETVVDETPPPADYNVDIDGPWTPSTVTRPLRERFNAASDALLPGAGTNTIQCSMAQETGVAVLECDTYTVGLGLQPFKLLVLRNAEVVATLNEDSLMHYEAFREKPTELMGKSTKAAEASNAVSAAQEEVRKAEEELQKPEEQAGDDAAKEEDDGTSGEAKSTPEERRKEKEAVKAAADQALLDAKAASEAADAALAADMSSLRPHEKRHITLQGLSDGQGMWSEEHNGHTDDKEWGPSSIGMDVHFPRSWGLFGLPERSTPFALPVSAGPGAVTNSTFLNKERVDTEPYRMYNLDVNEYEMNDRMGLYGAVPFIVAHGKEGSAGVLWVNAAETFVDVLQSGDEASPAKSAHFYSEVGDVDVFIFSGSTPADVLRQYSSVAGRMALPPLFSLGYHQCRWNYNDDEDVRGIASKFDEYDIPFDVLWLDIEHTDGKKYFTWDAKKFPNPTKMIADVHAAAGQRMVTIIDPHMKADDGFHVYAEAKEADLLVKRSDGAAAFEGECWPGNSAWIDYVDPKARDFWAGKMAGYLGEMGFGLHTWNDMNEPSVFKGPETTMPKSLKHVGGVEHRDMHNMYGFYQTMATHQGHRQARPDERPFILTRAIFAGSQRYAALWTGDNWASWEHLAASTPMLLSLSVAGMPFVGADVGGFFRDPEEELLVRWYQVGSLQPFFRAHAHIETKRREPWLFPNSLPLIKEAIQRRYTLMPYIYSVFQESAATGNPVMRPLWWTFPQEEVLYGLDSAFSLGDALFIYPVTSAGTEEIKVRVPDSRFYLISAITGGSPGTMVDGPGTATVTVPLAAGAPILLRGGAIVPTSERPRRSTTTQKDDPITLIVGVSRDGDASGRLYVDDGHTMQHEYAGSAVARAFTFSDGTLKCSVDNSPSSATVGANTGDAGAPYDAKAPVERFVFLGLGRCPSSGTLVVSSETPGGAEVRSEVSCECPSQPTDRVVCRRPWAPVARDWSFTFN